MALRVAAWDAPLRLFHWALAALVVFSFISGKVGGALLEWHMRSGYAILALLLFRLAWGIAGSHTARFASFVRGPRAVMGYLRASRAGRRPRAPGHNPLGGWSVLAMLAVLLLQATSGLFVDDEIATQGPLAGKVPNAVVARMSAFHSYNEWLVVGLVALHLAAIAYYHWVARVDLVGAMLHGNLEVEEPIAAPAQAPAWLAAVLAAIAAAAVYVLVVIYPRG
ncbi:MAG TPA: cytochrome b/b6 domain-containing protein [Usitatibacter sp.]|nr:cytochrome b/b6 domain-containing protein [Usitatibacter sp.]